MWNSLRGQPFGALEAKISCKRRKSCCRYILLQCVQLNSQFLERQPFVDITQSEVMTADCHQVFIDISQPPSNFVAEPQDDADTSDEDLLIPASASASKNIRWQDRQQRPRSRLMPSFTKKSLEFHNCPKEIVPPPNRIKSGRN